MQILWIKTQLIALAVIALISACAYGKKIDKCDGAPAGDFLQNPDTTCAYVWLYCDGDNSQYCSETVCDEKYECDINVQDKLSEICADVTVGDFVRNPNKECEYIWVYCDGVNSQYCSAEICDTNFVCPAENTETTTTAATTTSTSTTTTTTTTASTSSSSSTSTSTTTASSTLPTTTTASTIEPTTSSSSATSTLSDYASIRERCQSGVYQRYPYPEFENYYYQCVDGYLLVQTCGMGYHFDSELLLCVQNPKQHGELGLNEVHA